MSWPHALPSALQDWIAAHPGSAAAFDFDDTLLGGDISETLLDLIDQDGQLTAAYHASCEEDLHTGYTELVHTLVEGKTPAECTVLAEGALSVGIAAGRLKIRSSMVELVKQLLAHEWEVWIVTASPGVLVVPVALRYGIASHRVLGMEPTIDATGRFCRPLQQPVPMGPGKLALFNQRAGRPLMLAAGDSKNDFALLEAAQRALFIDRGRPDHRPDPKWWTVRSTIL